MSKENYAFTINQQKVCENVELKMKLDLQIKNMELEYKEILELFELFDHFNETKFHTYTSSFNKKFKEIKRNLKNTEKRLKYNMIRC
jgi:hypothetical protein